MAIDCKKRSIKNNSQTFQSSRRGLLRGLSLAGLAAGSAAAATALPASVEPLRDDPRALDYRETPHIKTFYDLARR